MTGRRFASTVAGAAGLIAVTTLFARLFGFARGPAGQGDPAREVLAAQQGTDPRDEQPLRERLRNIVVGAHRQPERLVELVVLRGQENHRHGRRLDPQVAHAAQQFHPVHPRHLDVEHADVGGIVGERLQRGIAIGVDAGREPLGLEGDRHRRQDVAVVVHQRDRGGHIRRRSKCMVSALVQRRNALNRRGV